MAKKIVDQQLKWDEKTNECAIVTKYSDGSVSFSPVSSEEAARFQAEHGF